MTPLLTQTLVLLLIITLLLLLLMGYLLWLQHQAVAESDRRRDTQRKQLSEPLKVIFNRGR